MHTRTLATVIGMLVALAAPGVAQSAFRADFELTRADDPTGGIVKGAITYDLAGRRYRYDYDDRDYREIFRFEGGDATARGSRYQIGAKCTGGCRSLPVTHPMPVYAYDPATYHHAGFDPDTGCSSYEPNDPSASPLTRLQLGDDGLPCAALWADGSSYRFSNFSYVDEQTPGLFDEPADCGNGERLDLLILVDRSASVSSQRYEAARAYVRDLLGRLTISASQVNVAVAHFDVGTELVLPFQYGTSAAVVDAVLGGMSCTCGDTLDPTLMPRELAGKAAPTCCGRRTSVAGALAAADDLFATAGRPDQPELSVITRHVVLVVTDGRSNTLRDGVTPCKLKECRADMAAALEQLRQRYFSIEVQGIDLRAKKPRPATFTAKGAMRRATGLLEPVATCSTAEWCDPATCHGLCECGECTAPSACEPSGDYCVVNTIVPGGRVCEPVPYDCRQEFPSRCDNAYCDPVAQQCKKRPVVCTASSQPNCMVRSCLPLTGECITDVLPDPTCRDECQTDVECNDGNLCTVDRCVSTQTFKVCKFTPRTCDDNDPCSEDFCTDPSVGCQARPKPSTFCDDGISCTVDACVPGSGCTHVPLPCDDGQSCTVDVCDESTGYCSNREPTAVCPAGLTPALGHCWVHTRRDMAESCDGACAARGLQYDPATATLVGSEGTDANCGFVLATLGLGSAMVLPSDSCLHGIGCFHTDVNEYDPFAPVGGGRCAEPPTDAGSWKATIARVCACR